MFDPVGQGNDSEQPENQQARLGGSQSGMRLYNERLVISLIRRHSSLPKAEIARLTGLSAQTCSVIVKGLEAEGILKKENPVRGRVGQPSVPFSLHPEGAYSIGLKIGRRSADILLMNIRGGVLARHSMTYLYPEPARLLDFAKKGWSQLEMILPAPARKRIAGLGVAMPGEIWNWAREVGAPAEILERWRGLDIRAELEAISPWPVLIQNDATAACAAELVFGSGGRYRDFLYIYVGSFVGGGIVMDGRLVPGRRGNAGAVGSMLVPDGRGGAHQLIQCASIFALENLCRAAGFDPSELWAVDEAWLACSSLVDQWIEESAIHIAMAVISAVALNEFEAVILDGGFPPDIRRRLRERVGHHVDCFDRQGLSPFELVEGTLGRNAKAMGGASLPILAGYGIDSELFFREPA